MINYPTCQDTTIPDAAFGKRVWGKKFGSCPDSAPLAGSPCGPADGATSERQ